MHVTTDNGLKSSDASLDFIDEILVDEDSGACKITLEMSGIKIEFEDIYSGDAKLFRQDAPGGIRQVAIDAYDKGRIMALATLFASNPSALVESIEWQEDDGSNWSPIPVVMVFLVIATVIGFLASQL
ncbi:MAG: hypothetical protein AB8B96_21035 [Lysobacterales bacterium]